MGQSAIILYIIHTYSQKLQVKPRLYRTFQR